MEWFKIPTGIRLKLLSLNNSYQQFAVKKKRKMLDVGGPAEICLMSCVLNGFINNLGDLSALTPNSKLLSAANPSEDNLWI